MSSKSDNDGNSSGDDEDFEAHAHLFRSSLDVGSHFIDIVPENELTFYNSQGVLFSQLTIKNVTSKAHVAYFVFTSAPYPIKIMPKNGFIPPMYQQVINIGWQDKPDAEKLGHAMFFIKALPLSHDMNVDEMNGNLVDVFNTYNVNILFTVAALPAKVSLAPMLGAPGGGAGGNANLIMSPSTQPPGGNPAQPGFGAAAQKAGANLPPLTHKTFGDDELGDSESQILLPAERTVRKSKGKSDGKLEDQETNYRKESAKKYSINVVDDEMTQNRD